MSRPVSASEFVVTHIRQSILKNELKPGSQIKQHALAAELGVSHVPLREAIKKLEAEGFLTLHPRRGAFVRPLTIDDVEEVFDLRIILETDALRRSIPELNAEQLESAQEICSEADEVKDTIRYGGLNDQFHSALYIGAARPLQQDMILSLWRNAARYSSLLRLVGEHFEQSQVEHWEMTKAASDNNVEKACEILQHHLTSAVNAIVSIMRKEKFE